MRTNLITHFHCSACGSQLEISLTKPAGICETHADWQTAEEPTGAFCAYRDIWIEPCQQCIEMHTRPAKMLADGINALLAIKNQL